MIDLKKKEKKTKYKQQSPQRPTFPVPVRDSIISHDELSFLVRYGARRFLICIVTDSVKKGNFVKFAFLTLQKSSSLIKSFTILSKDF